MRKLLLASIALSAICASGAQAASFATSPSTIKPQTLNVYATFGNGDVIFQLTTNSHSAACTGYWLRASDAGFKNLLAALYSASTTQTALSVSGDDSVLWTGSGTAYCLVSNLTL